MVFIQFFSSFLAVTFNIEDFALKHLNVPCDYQKPPEKRIESKNQIIVEEVIAVSLGEKKQK